MTEVPAATAELDIYCPDCGYNLRGIQSARCPECGTSLDSAKLAENQIPWTHRADLGIWRAYWRTVWMVSRNPYLLARHVQQNVRLEDALRFRRMTVWVAYLPLAAVLVMLYFTAMASNKLLSLEDWWVGKPPAVRVGLMMDWGLLPVALVALYLVLLALSGVASYFFHPPNRPIGLQNRAVALSSYSCAPLAWTPTVLAVIGSVAGLAALGLLDNIPFELGLLMGFILGGLVILQLVVWWVSTLRLLKQTVQASTSRLVTAGIALPLLWALLVAIIGATICAVYISVCLVILSLMN